MAAAKNPPMRTYAKPVVVPSRLDDLRGPTAGVVDLPRHLQWSGNPHYELSQPLRVMDLYRTVLNEAATPDDIHRYLDRATLISLWPSMWLPRPVREAWESRFADLASRRRDAAT